MASTKCLKRAIKREPGIPVGELAPIYLDCECGHHLPIRGPKQDCVCGRIYDRHVFPVHFCRLAIELVVLLPVVSNAGNPAPILLH